MATIVNNGDGTLTVTITSIEDMVVAGLTDDSLAQYITLWLDERARAVFNDKFNLLAPQDQANVLAMFAGL